MLASWLSRPMRRIKTCQNDYACFLAIPANASIKTCQNDYACSWLSRPMLRIKTCQNDYAGFMAIPANASNQDMLERSCWLHGYPGQCFESRHARTIMLASWLSLPMRRIKTCQNDYACFLAIPANASNKDKLEQVANTNSRHYITLCSLLYNICFVLQGCCITTFPASFSGSFLMYILIRTRGHPQSSKLDLHF